MTMLCPKCWGSKVFSKSRCDHCSGLGTVPDLQLSPHFRLSEFLRSQTATRHRIPNCPDEKQLANLTLTAQTLERVRTKFGPIHINSGFRSKQLNAKIAGSSSTSAHMRGFAADFISSRGTSLKTMVDWIVAQKFDYDQCIYEGTWVHLGVKAPNGRIRRKNYMMFPNKLGKPTYYIYDAADPRVL